LKDCLALNHRRRRGEAIKPGVGGEMLRAHYSLLYAIAVAFLVGLIAQGRAVVPLKRLYLETLGPYISRMPENEDKRSAPLVDRKTVDTVTSS